MQDLIAVIVTWLSINLGLPASYEHPSVRMTDESEMIELRLERSSNRSGHAEVQIGNRADAVGVYAVYDEATRTIYLPDNWSAASPAETSILVHELVHHLQNLEGGTYACAEEREKLAYAAQAKWLEMFDTSLAEEFGIDPMTLLVRTNCLH